MGLLDGLLGGRSGGILGSGGGLSSPITMALLALLVSRGFGNNKQGGGLLGQLGNLGGLGGSGGMGSAGSPLSGGLLSGGLGALLQQFQANGLGDKIKSWIGTGDNQPIAPGELNQALGPETVKTLADETGMPQKSLLSELASLLPGFVDQATPDGKIPTEAQANQNTGLDNKGVA